jgi:hypothetical protein
VWKSLDIAVVGGGGVVVVFLVGNLDGAKVYVLLALGGIVRADDDEVNAAATWMPAHWWCAVDVDVRWRKAIAMREEDIVCIIMIVISNNIPVGIIK